MYVCGGVFVSVPAAVSRAIDAGLERSIAISGDGRDPSIDHKPKEQE